MCYGCTHLLRRRVKPVMAKSASTPTRVAADIAATAASVGQSENRTMAEQINYWTRLGMHLDRSTTAECRRVQSVITGEAQFSSLTPAERTVAHSSIDTEIAARAASARFGLEARKAGQVTVSIDDDGNLIEIAPDGTRQQLAT